MSDLITDEMVEAAARAYHEAAPEAVAGSWDVSTPRIHERGLVRARAALDAAAPAIAATALRDAADWLDDMARGHRETAYLGAGRDLISRLRARAKDLVEQPEAMREEVSER